MLPKIEGCELCRRQTYLPELDQISCYSIRHDLPWNWRIGELHIWREWSVVDASEIGLHYRRSTSSSSDVGEVGQNFLHLWFERSIIKTSIQSIIPRPPSARLDIFCYDDVVWSSACVWSCHLRTSISWPPGAASGRIWSDQKKSSLLQHGTALIFEDRGRNELAFIWVSSKSMVSLDTHQNYWKTPFNLCRVALGFIAKGILLINTLEAPRRQFTQPELEMDGAWTTMWTYSF